MSSSSLSSGSRPRIFISLRFSEASREAEMLKAGLEAKGIPTFLCSTAVGDDIADDVGNAIDACELAVIMGSKTYGIKTNANFSTYEELGMILEDKKPFFLVKMCDRFEVPRTRLFLRQSIAYFPWQPGTPMPSGIVEDVLDKLRNLNLYETVSTPGEMSGSAVYSTVTSTSPQRHGVSNAAADQHQWLHGKISRSDAEALLKRSSRDGSFLVRESESSPGSYVLVLCSGGKALNYRINRSGDGSYFFNEQSTFSTLADLIRHHQHNADGLPTRLDHAVANEAAQHQTGASHEPVYAVPSTEPRSFAPPANQAELEADAVKAIKDGDEFEKKGAYRSAVQCYERALSKRVDAYGDEHVKVAECYVKLWHASLQDGKVREAAEYSVEAARQARQLPSTQPSSSSAPSVDRRTKPASLRRSGAGAVSNKDQFEALLSQNDMSDEIKTKIRRVFYGSSGKNLDLHHNSIGDIGAAALGKALETNNSLQTLNLYGNSIGDSGAAALGKALKTNSSLQYLDLSDNSIGASGATALGKALETNSSLRELNLGCNSIGPSGATALGKALKTNNSLQTLNLAWNSIWDNGAAALCKALETNSSLETLKLGNNSIWDSGAAAVGKALEANSSLGTLDLDYNSIGDSGAAALGKALETNNSLQKLYLQSNSIGDSGAAALGKAMETNSSLQTLHLWSNSIGDSGAAALGKALETNSSLQELHLDSNSIGDSGAAALGKALDTNSSLQELHLRRNSIGDSGAAALGKALETNNSLQKLYLYRNNLSDTGKQRLSDIAQRSEGRLKAADIRSRTTSFGSIKSSSLHAHLNKKHAANTGTRHISLKHELLICSIKEELIMHYAVYDADKQIFVSENFMVELDRSCSPKDPSKVNNINAMFTDIHIFKSIASDDASADIKELFLVCYVSRIGHMLADGKESKQAGNHRRPFACAACPLMELLRKTDDDIEEERHLDLFKTKEEKSFGLAHQYICKGDTSKIVHAEEAKLHIKLKVLVGDLTQVKHDNPLLFDRGTSIVQPLDISESLQPGSVRNDLYVTLAEAKVSQGSKSAGRNIQSRVIVVDKDGNQINEAISAGAGTMLMPEYTSTIYYHNNNPVWNEIFCIRLPVQKFTQCHFKLYLKHCSSSSDSSSRTPFAFTFLPLMKNDDGIAIQDGDLSLPLYKYDERLDSTNQGTPSYLTHQGQLHAGKDVIKIRIKLCSTKLTQTEGILKLLKFREQPTEQLSETLNKFTYIFGHEVVKFLSDILDALFTILDEHETLSQQVFSALVHVIRVVVEDKRFVKFKPVLDNYIDNHFSGAKAHTKLVDTLLQSVDKARDMTYGKALREALAAIDYIFKFIIQSCVVQERHFGRASFRGHVQQVDRDAPKRELRRVFAAFDNLMKQTYDGSAVNQSKILQNFASVFDDLHKVLNSKEIGELARNFMESVQASAVKIEAKQAKRINEHKLQFLLELVKGALFQTRASRREVLSTLTATLRDHLVHKQLLDMTLDVIGDLLATLHSSPDCSFEDVMDAIRALLLPLLNLGLQSTKPGRHDVDPGMLLSCLMALLRLGRSEHYDNFFAARKAEGDLADIVSAFFDVFIGILSREPFTSDWMVMRMLQSEVMLSMTRELCETLKRDFQSADDFRPDIWEKFFRFAAEFVCQRDLQIEHMSDIKRSKVLGQHGDKREQMATYIVEMWRHLGNRQEIFAANLAGSFQRIALLPHRQIRKLVIPLLRSTSAATTAGEDGNAVASRSPVSSRNASVKESTSSASMNLQNGRHVAPIAEEGGEKEASATSPTAGAQQRRPAAAPPQRPPADAPPKPPAARSASASAERE